MPRTAKYRGYKIVPKRDFGPGPGYFIDGKYVKKGWLITDGLCNVAPGATWFESIALAQEGIDALIAAGADSDKFWAILHASYAARRI